MSEEFVDVLIVGAGLSGIGAACHLRMRCPDRSLAIVEARQDLGGTWDLFRYPGVRSDSDMHTLGYSFRPWTAPQDIANGLAIQNYLRDTAAEHGVDRRIRYGHRVLRADWSTADARWTVQVRRGEEEGPVTIHCGFLFMCSGYYDHGAGHQPSFPGQDMYSGRVVHPQHWPPDLDHAGKKVVVIGSGATAVTLVPALAESAAHVTMLQRSPTWMASRPSLDPISMRLRRWLPLRAALAASRWKNLLFGMYVVRLSRRSPRRVRKMLLGGVRQALGPDADIATHFTPRYDPWQQRLCLVPDGDLFQAIRTGRASVVTDQVASYTANGLLLQSGTTLEADIVVTATGLKLAVLGQAEFHVDGQQLDPAELVNYKGVMYGGVPNLANTFGYERASWTLKSDLTARHVCRLLNHMRATGARICLPPRANRDMPLLPSIDLSSGYFQRALDRLPKQGALQPWRLGQNYLSDLWTMRFQGLESGGLTFSR